MRQKEERNSDTTQEASEIKIIICLETILVRNYMEELHEKIDIKKDLGKRTAILNVALESLNILKVEILPK